MKNKLSIFLITIITLTGCTILEVATDVTWEAAKLTGRAVKGAVHIAQGKQTIRLKRVGNSFLTDSVINRKRHATLLIDTGASNVMLSKSTALKLGYNLNKADRIQAKLADGKVVPGRVIILKELKVGGATATNIPAIVLEQTSGGNYDGLLGMSFLNKFIFQIDATKGELILQKR
ncbi:MAG: clan AA aspartic protease [Candidatus Omnitrophica bacterium]|nr:clan AA aspartic protease [Candidatus Omnitrophota bacterium]